jgi:anti-sigma factor (TIGR02949 family)
MSTSTASTGCPGSQGMDCAEAVAKLWDYLEGQLDDADRAAVRQHVERCAHCFPHADFGQVMLEAVAQVRRAEPAAPSFREGVLNRLRAEGYEGP